MSSILDFFNSDEFMPHGHCFLWEPQILWLHVISDADIAAAYFSIPFALIYFIRKRRDIPFPLVFWLFGAFIVLCGTTHLMSILTIWKPDYALEGVIKAATAIVSITTFFYIARMMPQALSLASPTTLATLNEELQENITQRDKAERELKNAYRQMESNIQERTAELTYKNQMLENEILERNRIEGKLNKALDELTKSNNELQRFAYICSHDLQEPARMVSSYSKLLALKIEGKLDGDAEKYLHFMHEGADRIQEMIKSILSYSRIESKENQHEPVDLNNVVRDVLNFLQPVIEETGAVINVGTLPKIYGDKIQFVQMFQNLIGNGIKFRKKGVIPEINVYCEELPDRWQFMVQDNGIGISEEYLEKIFIIFQRLNRKEDYPGSGIGLAICKKIVERYGGRIWAESVEDLGTTFYFTIPKNNSRKTSDEH